MSTVGGKEGTNHTENSGFSTTDDPTLSEQKTSAATESARPPITEESSTTTKIMTDSGSTSNTIYTEVKDEIVSMGKFIQKGNNITMNTDGSVVVEQSADSNGGSIAISLFNEVDVTEYSTEIQEYITEVNRLAT